MSKDFSFAVPISPNADRWEIDEESMSGLSSHDEIWNSISDRSKEIMISDIKRNLNDQVLSDEISYYMEHRLFSISDPSDPSKSYKFVKVDCFRHLLIHLPKTGGRYFYSNYNVVKHTVGREHVHPTFNASHLSASGLKLCPLYGVVDPYDDLRPDELESFQSFITIVRNPYDWLASFYFTNNGFGWNGMAHVTDKKITFEQFIRSICERDNIGKEINRKIYPFDKGITSPLFSISGDLCVGNIIFFERMALGAESLNIKKRKSSEISESMTSWKKPSGRDDYRNLYTDELAELVFDKFRFDFDFLGYDFDGICHDKPSLLFDKPMNRNMLIASV